MRNKVIRDLTLLAALVLGQLAASQPHAPGETATNADILEMLALEIPHNVIIDYIETTSLYSFSLDPSSLAALEDAGANPGLVQAMRDKITPHAGDPRLSIAVESSAKGTGGFWPGNLFGAMKLRSGAGPLEDEIAAQFAKHCEDARFERDRHQADYTMVLERKAGKGLLRKVNQISVYKPDGSLVYSGGTRTLTAAIRDTCAFVMVDQLVAPE